MIRLIYNGLERCDFVYYLALLVSTSGTAEIVVNDTSVSGDLFNLFNTDENFHKYKNIIFTRNLDEVASYEALNGIEYYIEYRGMNMESLGNTPNTFHFIMPGYTKEGIDLARDLRPEGNAVYILRDYCSKKVTDKGFALAAGLRPSDIDGHIPLNIDDMSSYQALTINGHQKFTHLSDEMNQALIWAYAQITMTDEKTAAKHFKKVRRAK